MKKTILFTVITACLISCSNEIKCNDSKATNIVKKIGAEKAENLIFSKYRKDKSDQMKDLAYQMETKHIRNYLENNYIKGKDWLILQQDKAERRGKIPNFGYFWHVRPIKIFFGDSTIVTNKKTMYELSEYQKTSEYKNSTSSKYYSTINKQSEIYAQSKIEELGVNFSLEQIILESIDESTEKCLCSANIIINDELIGGVNYTTQKDTNGEVVVESDFY